MAEELKACPFCGRIPKTSHRPESEASGGGHVAFVVCYCGGYASTAHQMGHAETVQAAIAEVVEKWNTRAQMPSQGGEAVAMRQRFSHIEDEIMAGKHTAASVFTQMRTAALYTHPAYQVAEPGAELVELLHNMPGWIGGDWAEAVRAKLASLK